jgi:hypothetical protein
MDTISDLYVKRRTQPIITKFGSKEHIISKYIEIRIKAKRYKCFHPPLAYHQTSFFFLSFFFFFNFPGERLKEIFMSVCRVLRYILDY